MKFVKAFELFKKRQVQQSSRRS